MPLAATREEYDDWYAEALAEDQRTGALRWKEQPRSNRYDHRIIRDRLTELEEVRNSGDVRQLLYYFDEGMHGNMAGIGAPGLYRRAKTGTKTLIEDYIAAVDEGLSHLATVDDSDLSVVERLNFFRRARQAFGRPALMLSGAGSLGPFHLGVAQALASQDLVPSVISGSSAGAIVAAIVCTHDSYSLLERLSAEAIIDSFEDVQEDNPTGARLRQDAVREMIANWIPDLTFAEAHALSGRSLNVSVAPSSLHQQPRTLNEVTSPNVLIREAVLASCAVPGVYPPVALMARDASGERTPYVQNRTFVDGSVTNDMPVHPLTRVYGCNFFIASQTNPIVRWALGEPNNRGLVSQAIGIYQAAAKEVLRETYPIAMRLTRNIPPLGAATRMWYSVVTQNYTADVNILPKQRFWDPTKLLAPLTPEGAMHLIESGRNSTWPHVERIRNCTMITRRVEEAIASLSEQVTR